MPLPLAPCLTNLIIEPDVLETLRARSAQQDPNQMMLDKVLEEGEINGGKVWLPHEDINAQDSNRLRMQASIAAVIGGRVKLAVELDHGYILRLHLNAGRDGHLHYLGAMYQYLHRVNAFPGNRLIVQDLGEITFQAVVRPVFGICVLPV